MKIQIYFDTEEFYLIPRVFIKNKYRTNARFEYVNYEWAISIDWFWFEFNVFKEN